ncbi:MAG: hypothetical protein WB559_12825 [Candidatus Acidiferrales bacterium]
METIQTQNAANGGLVGSKEVTTLPLVSRNYTQIVSLSPGVVANVASASAIGSGTQDVAANGSRQNQNNYSMDGSSVVNYLSGTGAQTGSFPGIAIPNPDTIQEFKVQTSQYDASSGRNPGANVDVVTKTGTNEFHGALWEFNRNNFFNANDFFYKQSEARLGVANKPQTLKQNTFGGTFGGPIIKDKFFIFGSYQGFRQQNGIGTSGFASGYAPNTLLLPWDDPSSPSDPRHLSDSAAYKAYLGSVFGNGLNSGFLGFLGGTGITIAPDGSNISNTAIGYLQAAGPVKGGFNHGFYFPSAPAGCQTVMPGRLDSGCVVAISDPVRANEDQYLINTQYHLTSKHTLEERYMYETDPQLQPFNCFITAGNCDPGTPINAHYFNHIGQLKLTSLLTNSFVNEARFSFHRDVENNSDLTTAQSCNASSTFNVIPLVNNGEPCPLTTTPPNSIIAKRFPETNLLPMIDSLGILGVSGPWSQGGNFAMISSNFNNTFQYADQVSWNHGKHTIRAGFEAERIQHNGTIPAAERGELLMYNTADFLTSSSGRFDQDPTYDDGTPRTPGGGIVVGFGLKGFLTHYNRVNAFTSYVQDDIKVNSKLTVNVGVRWEYSGFPDDVTGRFSNVWASQLATVNTGSFFLNNPAGTLAGFVVPSNYDKTYGLTAPNGASGVLVNSNKTLVPGTPLHNFAPRLGLAWQPLGNRFVVRAGYGWFYDRVYGNLLIDNQLNLPPYSGAGSGPSPQSQANTLHDPFFAGAGPLAWTPRTITCAGPCANENFISSGLGYTSDSPQLSNRLPLTYEYNLDLQYEFLRGWVGDVGFVGTHGIHLYNWSVSTNPEFLVQGAPNSPTLPQDVGMIRASLPFNDPANAFPITMNTNGASGNGNERVPFLGFSSGGVAQTLTTGDQLYNSLQAQLRHQFSHGLYFQVSYTWSKQFTNVDSAQAGSGIQPPGAVLYGASNSNNPLDLTQQYGLASFNRSQRAVISYSYDLPWKHTEGLTGKVLGGWTISGVTTIQNGQPFTITDSNGGSIYGLTDSRAALVDPVNCNARGLCQSGIPLASSGSTKQRALSNWLNTGAFLSMATSGPGALLASSTHCIGGTPNPGPFGPPNPNDPCGQNFAPARAPGTFGPGDPGAPADPGAPFIGAGTGFGDSGKATVLGPGQFNWDMSVIKNIKVGGLREDASLQFRAEFYNIWNHAQFNPPGGINVGTAATFGKITSTSVTPRVIQFAVKYIF